MSQGDIERVILGSLVLNPALIETNDKLTSSLFSSPRARQTFEIIAKMYEDKRPKEIDQLLLAERLGFEGALSYVGSLTNGLHHLNSGIFVKYVNELWLRRRSEKIVSLSESLGRDHLKAGQFDSKKFSKLLGVVHEYEELKEPRKKTGIKFASRFLTEIEMRPITWTWYPVLAEGMVTSLLAEPGLAKTYLAVDLSTRIVTGQPFPAFMNPSEEQPSAHVAYISSEGVPDKILKPRFHAAGADPGMIRLIEGTYNNQGDFQILDVREHLPALKDFILAERKNGRNYKLVVIDPLASFLSEKVKLNDTIQARQALDHIARFAEDAAVVTLVILYPNKDETKKLMNRSSGSVQMSAAVKIAAIIAPPKEDDPENLRYLSIYKSNLAPIPRNKALPFYLEDASFDHGGSRFEVAKIRWADGIVSVNVEEIISPRVNEGLSLIAKAGAFLLEQVKDGPKPATDLYALAEERGIGSKTLWRAKASLGIEDRRDGYQGRSIWFLPKAKTEGKS